jgi:hypothetical protein
MNATRLDALESILPHGADHGTTVRFLHGHLGWHERTVRRAMRELRKDRHIPVVALTRPNGVFIADPADLALLKRTRTSLHSRAMKVLVLVTDMDQIIADIEMTPDLLDVVD